MAVEVWSPFSFSVIKLSALFEMKINKRSICERNAMLCFNPGEQMIDVFWSVSDTGLEITGFKSKIFLKYKTERKINKKDYYTKKWFGLMFIFICLSFYSLLVYHILKMEAVSKYIVHNINLLIPNLKVIYNLSMHCSL